MNGRVLSIQSHVVHGYVGNKCVTFPLQLLGFDVDAINSVQFCNHSEYNYFAGQVLKESDLVELIDGLEKNDLLKNYTHLLTGYNRSVPFLRQIPKILQKLRNINPNVIYVCDPVMGDDGKLYVPEEIVPIYRDEIIPHANIVTPNQYEIELLTGIKINVEDDVWKAINVLHEKNIEMVLLSSSNLDNGNIKSYLSEKNGKKLIITIPMQGGDIKFTGTGDLFTTLILAHKYLQKDSKIAFETTIATLQAVIKRTVESIPPEVKLEKKRKPKSEEIELKLIQSKNEIENPVLILEAKSYTQGQ